MKPLFRRKWLTAFYLPRDGTLLLWLPLNYDSPVSYYTCAFRCTDLATGNSPDCRMLTLDRFWLPWLVCVNLPILLNRKAVLPSVLIFHYNRQCNSHDTNKFDSRWYRYFLHAETVWFMYVYWEFWLWCWAYLKLTKFLLKRFQRFYE